MPGHTSVSVQFRDKSEQLYNGFIANEHEYDSLTALGHQIGNIIETDISQVTCSWLMEQIELALEVWAKPWSRNKERLRGALKNVFVRDRILNIKKLILFIMKTKSALQRDLDRFFKEVKNEDFHIRKVTKGGLSTAREKLADYPHYQDTMVTCRLIKIVLADGSKEILCTSLLDKEKYPYEEFSEL